MHIEPLTTREEEILANLALGLTNQEIADRLTLAVSSVKWYVRQIYGKLNVNSRKQAIQQARELGLLSAGAETSLPDNNLPAQISPFIGRTAELDTLTKQLQDPAVRLLTIAGPGGIGKTRTAIQAAGLLLHEAAGLFADGVFFVSLAQISSVQGIVTEIARVLDFAFKRSDTVLVDQLLQYLRGKRYLLVLDNYEHLIDAEGEHLPVQMLSAVPELKIIITSRTRLKAAGEHLLLLHGLNIPSQDSIQSWKQFSEQIRAYGSLLLFQQSARRLSPEFSLSPENIAHVAAICRHVEGLPLGIELAAAWVQLLEPEEILAEIEKSLDFLETEQVGLSSRQLSFRAVFDTTWHLLDSDERQVVQALSIFRGGFSRLAAQQVAGVTLGQLRALVDKCWIQPESGGRFQMHELLRQYAHEKLVQRPADWQELRTRHSTYFCQTLRDHQPRWQGPDQFETYHKTAEEIQNIEDAWRWAIQQEDASAIGAALESLCRYHYWGAFLQAGESVCQEAAACMARQAIPTPSEPDGLLRPWIRALVWQSRFTFQMDQSLDLLSQAQELLERPELAGQDLGRERAFLLSNRAEKIQSNNPILARKLLDEVLPFYQSVGDTHGEAKTLLRLGEIEWGTGAYTPAYTLIQRSLEMLGQLGDRLVMAEAMNSLALTLKHIGKTEQAEQIQEEALKINLHYRVQEGILTLLSDLATTKLWGGKFTEAQELSRESLARQKDRGVSRGAAYGNTTLAAATMHLGQFKEARACSEISFHLASMMDDRLLMGLHYFFEGCLELATHDFTKAQGWFEESLRVFEEQKQNITALSYAGLTYAAIGLGQQEQARQQLCLALRGARSIGSMHPVLYTLPAAALWLAKQGRGQEALKIYTEAIQFPFIRDSHWFGIVAGQSIEESTSGLPRPEAGQEPWALVEQLIADVCM